MDCAPDHRCPDDERCTVCGAIPLHILHGSLRLAEALPDPLREIGEAA
jgi:hypothetical protein